MDHTRPPELEETGILNSRYDSNKRTMSLRILVIDADEHRGNLYKKVLNRRQHRVEIFHDADSAVEAFRKEFYPFVILDCGLPKINCADICVKIRSAEAGQKSIILILTGENELEEFSKYLEVGADDFIQKPLVDRMLDAKTAIVEKRVSEIFENRLTAEQLRRLSLIAKRTDNLVVLTDKEGRIEWVNEGFERVTEYRLNDVIGKRPGEFLQGKETDPSTVAYMKKQLEKKCGFDVEIINYSKSGRKYWLSIEVRPIFDENGKLTNYMAIESDITALKMAQEEIARAREQEMETGSRIQRSLLFGKPPEYLEGGEVAVLAIPSQKIDGDFFDVHRHNSDFFDVLIGDVMGKGVPAALVGAAAKSEFLRAESHLVTTSKMHQLPEPEEIIMAAHTELTKELLGLESFVTMCLARFDSRKHEARFVNCGHTGIIHYFAKAGECRSYRGLNLPLGVDNNEIYKQVCVSANTGDIFLFYSDGVTEARNTKGELLGETRLKKFVCDGHNLSPKELVDKLREMVLFFSAPNNLFDDVTCVAVKIK